jgi:hypothetical protein
MILSVVLYEYESWCLVLRDEERSDKRLERERWIAHSMLQGKPEGKTPLGRPRRRWVVNIKLDLDFEM